MEIEFAILDFIQEHMRNAVLDFLMPLITKLGDAGIFWILLAVVLLLFKKTRKTGLILAAALLMDLLLCNILIKPLVARARPFEMNPSVSLLVKKPGDYSFPSGHTAASFASVTALFLAKEKRLWKLALLLACLLAFSRLYLYVHFPTDILGGIVFGIAAGIAGFMIVRITEKQINKNKIQKSSEISSCFNDTSGGI